MNETPESRKAVLLADLAALDEQIAKQRAIERAPALAQVLELIKTHKITKAELEPALRKRAFAPRKRKSKTVLKAA